jgi:group I intron endonuclease
MEFKYEGKSALAGIYKITNKINGRIYVGSAKTFRTRWGQHAYSIRNQKHQNKFLQADFNKSGEDAFVFEILEAIEGSKEVRLQREQYYIDEALKTPEKCYNVNKKAVSSEGWKPKNPEEFANLCRQRSLEMWQRPEHIEKMKAIASSPEKLEKFRKTCHTKESKRKVGEQLAKYWGKIISPTGEVYDVMNLNRFCEEHGLIKQSMIPVFKGEVYQALGWRLYDETLVGVPYSAVEHQKGKEFEIVSPNGTVYRSRNVWEFCRVHDLQQGNLNKVLLGKRKSHKGWHLPDNSL